MKFRDDQVMDSDTHLFVVAVIKQHFNRCQFVDCPCFALVNEPGMDINKHLRASGDLIIDFATTRLDYYDQLNLNNLSEPNSGGSASSRRQAVFLYLTEDKIKR